ncbi:plasmid pRiA4b ORF-3 family protein [Rheinheimera sp.]|uniref:plasmid pRiA4b ORF-3 family protein n=1 Tax=Rheinheimera sp. TaxID=1869214 RepID=UPI004047E9AF
MTKLNKTQQKQLQQLLVKLQTTAAFDNFNARQHEALLELPATVLFLTDSLLQQALTEQAVDAHLLLLKHSAWLSKLNYSAQEAVAALPAQLEQRLGRYLTMPEADVIVVRAILTNLFQADLQLSEPLMQQFQQREQAMFSQQKSDIDIAVQPEIQFGHFLAQIGAELPDADSFELADYLFSQFSTLPAAALQILPALLLRQQDVRLQQCASLFLLHPNRQFRQVVYGILPQLADDKLLQGLDLQRFIWLRNLVPANEQAVLDTVIKQLQRQQLTWQADTTVKVLKLYVTPLDSSGAMALNAELQLGKRYRFFSCVLKQGVGVKDAMISPAISRTEINNIRRGFSEELPLCDISAEQMTALLAHFLVDNRAAGSLPLYLMQFKQCLPSAWQAPQRLDAAMVSQMLLANNGTERPLELADFISGWAAEHPDCRTPAQYIKNVIEPERALWQERCLVCAYAFAQTAEDVGHLLEAANAIASGKPLARQALFKAIADEATQPASGLDAFFQQVLEKSRSELVDNDDSVSLSDMLAEIWAEVPEAFVPENRPKRAVYQIKVQLKDSKPPIWRNIELMNTVSLAKLHLILQLAMGWDDEHGYEFYQNALRFVPDWVEAGFDTFTANEAQLRDLLQRVNDKMHYDYDFGDNWRHIISLQKILPAQRSNCKTQILKARGACPPEDIGGIHRYNQLREQASDPTSAKHKASCRELGVKSGKWDPDAVNIESLNKLLADI